MLLERGTVLSSCMGERSCTYCPKCGVLLISRFGHVFSMKVVKKNFTDDKYRVCDMTIETITVF